MLVRNKKSFLLGCLLLLSFSLMFIIMLFPVVPDGSRHLTGLQYADNVFNELSKGSSYFIPQVRKDVATLDSYEIQATVQIAKPDLAQLAALLLRTVGVEKITVHNSTISYSGNLGKILVSATEDAEKLYNNQAEPLADKYKNEPALKVAQAWWFLLTPTVTELQKQKHIGEAQIVNTVISKAIEQGNNFFGIQPVKVSQHVILLGAMLIFYLIYTLWYGFSIFELFDGLGLKMTK